MRPARWLLIAAMAVASISKAQERPDEASMFAESEATLEGAPDAGADAPRRAAEPSPSSDPSLPSGDRDSAELGGPAAQSRFDTDEDKSDALKVGGTLYLNGYGYWQEGRAFEKGSFSAPALLDAYLDGRPTDRLRAFALGRLQYDPTRPAGSTSTDSASLSQSSSSSSLVGLTPSTPANPSVVLDQLWLRFDIARKIYVTVGRQKVRWGTARFWYPTDFLNSQPRDVLNPFDVRLGVNMVKLHVPVESLGWNFYGYGLLDAVSVSSSGITVDQLGGAARAEFVLGPAELGLDGLWQKGRRPRYGVDLSAALGPIDFYAEVAFRDSRDFVLFDYPKDLTLDNLVSKFGDIQSYRPKNGDTRFGAQVMALASGGLSWQFNYTEKNTAVLALEYFYNPAGYTDAVGYQVKTFMPSLQGVTLDPIQNAPLYGGMHNVAAVLSAPSIPGADWITLNLSSIFVISDPAGLTRVDVIFRVLRSLSVQVFAAVFYGQTGGQLRFKVSSAAANDFANAAASISPALGEQIRTALAPLQYPPLVQAGLVLRLSI
jgi:hypothetical protein